MSSPRNFSTILQTVRKVVPASVTLPPLPDLKLFPLKKALVEPAVTVKVPPKYPIILCHGMGGDKPFLKYWTGIQTDLIEQKCQVHKTTVLRYATVYRRAESLKDQVLRIQDELKVEKVNLVAHSMGGLDSRHFISNLGGHKVVASLTTIGTPHRGSAYADFWHQIGDKVYLEQLLHMLMSGALRNLTSEWLNTVFNPQTPDHPDVKYYSIVGWKDFKPPHILYIPYRIINAKEGKNDGLVSVTSARWGEVLAELPIDHAEQINWSLSYDARGLYRELMNALHDRGC
jgi:triacylglycerol lipase